jgi:predicted transcriptional regulator
MNQMKKMMKKKLNAFYDEMMWMIDNLEEEEE